MLKRLFGDLLGRRGRAGVEGSCNAERQIDPFERARDLVRSRELDAAAAALDGARRELPEDERGHFLQAEILRLRGEFDAALPVFRRVLLANPGRVDAWIGLGDCSVRAGDVLQACIYYRTALSLEPERADVLNELGLIALARGNHTEAAEHFDQAVNFDPLHAQAWNNCGLVAASRGKIENARRCFHRASHLRPRFYTGLCNLGLACRDLGRLDEAAETLVRATQADPGKSAAWVNLALVRQDQGRLEEARTALATAAAAHPTELSVLTAYGVLLARLGETEAAEGMLAAALASSPDDAEANLALAHLDLIRGRYAQGWDRYDARLRATQSPRRRFPLPEWDGADAAGRALMVYAEQGLGDTIMFASCLPDLMRQASRVMIHCEDRLWPILQRSFPQLGRYDTPACGHVDGYAAIGSLPRQYRRSLDAFPRHRGYLQADPDRVARASAQLRALPGGRRVGVAWRGGLSSTGGATRSLDLGALEPLLGVPGVTWVSLQRDAPTGEIEAFERASGIRIHQLEASDNDVEDAAAAICALDLVVTVCCSVVHLAGALGKAAWVLTPHVPAWRYLLEGDSMPWYPTVTLVRQPMPGQWAQVIGTVAKRLADVRG